MPVYASRVVLLIGVIMIALSAFGVSFAAVNLFELGVAVCFLAGLLVTDRSGAAVGIA